MIIKIHLGMIAVSISTALVLGFAGGRMSKTLDAKVENDDGSPFLIRIDASSFQTAAKLAVLQEGFITRRTRRSECKMHSRPLKIIKFSNHQVFLSGSSVKEDSSQVLVFPRVEKGPGVYLWNSQAKAEVFELCLVHMAALYNPKLR